MLNGPEAPRLTRPLQSCRFSAQRLDVVLIILLLKTLGKPLFYMGYFIYYLDGDFCDLDLMLQ